MSFFIATLLAVSGLAIVHLFAGRLRLLDVTPRSRWLSIGSGVSVAYIFVHLLPELTAGQEAVARELGETLDFLEHHVYLLALIGLVVFYGLERTAKNSRKRRRAAGEQDATDAGVFWLHIVSFAVYNALIGYLLFHREDQSLTSLALFFVAMALHFVVNDHGLRAHHKATYQRIGRWALAAAVFLGWGLGLATEISEAALGILLAFLAGGLILNVLKEELPDERDSRFWAFALGAGAYALLLLGL